MELDIIFIQEVENEQLSLPGYNVVCNVDHARRGTAIALKDHIQFSHVEKSLDGRLIALRVLNTTLCCVYAPSGTALRAERERFFNNTIAYYLRHHTEHVILAGDFNCVLRQCDATGYNTSPALQATVQQLQLHDAWIKLNPRATGHTYITHNSMSRLDRVYVSPGLCEQLRTAAAHVCSFSNHKAVTVRVCLPLLGREQGRGYWSLRPHVLSTENIEEFQIRWQYWTRQRRYYASWMLWWLSYAKPKIKSFFRWKSKAAFNDFHREQQRLYAQLRLAYNSYYQNPAMLPTINLLKGQMLTLQRNFTQMFMRINETYVAGEPISTFQLGERRRKKTIITQLRGEHGEIINNSEAIESHMLQYFTDLYAEGETPEEVDDDFECERLVPENDATNAACMSDISTAEIFAAIKSSATKKSPGEDGIPREFYLRVFDTIHRELNLVINEALAGNFPSEYVNGVIVLVKKKSTDESARSYRPISLLNFDYKILSRILKCRLESVMRAHRILSESQKCSNSDRNIFQATLALKDRIAQLIANKQKGKLISFDLDHAFDRVAHSFLFRTLRSIGIHSQLVNLLSRVAELSSSRLLVNGHLSAAIPIQRSVRQGDPLSMHLFVLYLHPLVSKLERVCGTDLVVAYADDVSVIATCSHKIECMREMFRRFERVSGTMLNLRKTTSVDVGFLNEGRINVPWLHTANTVKILGVIFANSIRLMSKLNWDPLVSKFAQQIWLHRLRSLTLCQKITLLNTFVASKIWYLSSILSPYCVHTSKITATMGTFLWRGVPARVPMQQLARSKEKGGLKLHLPALKCKALLINRHLKEIESTPYYKSLIFTNNPTQANPLPDLPCLKLVCQQLRLLPAQIQQNTSADLVHQFYLQGTEIPKVERKNPTINWPRVWKNISIRQLTSAQRSDMFIIVNEKIEHRVLMARMQRADGEYCVHCNTARETLAHKFSECPRVAVAWRQLQQKTTALVNGWRRFSFTDLLQPVLVNIELATRIQIIKLFLKYITFINNNVNGRIDVAALEFHLDIEA